MKKFAIIILIIIMLGFVFYKMKKCCAKKTTNLLPNGTGTGTGTGTQPKAGAPPLNPISNPDPITAGSDDPRISNAIGFFINNIGSPNGLQAGMKFVPKIKTSYGIPDPKYSNTVYIGDTIGFIRLKINNLQIEPIAETQIFDIQTNYVKYRPDSTWGIFTEVISPQFNKSYVWYNNNITVMKYSPPYGYTQIYNPEFWGWGTTNIKNLPPEQPQTPISLGTATGRAVGKWIEMQEINTNEFPQGRKLFFDINTLKPF